MGLPQMMHSNWERDTIFDNARRLVRIHKTSVPEFACVDGALYGPRGPWSDDLVQFPVCPPALGG